MLQSAVLRKTKKGADEVETRQHRLPGRLRNALIMVDGERDVASYLEQAGELAPQIEQYLQDLLTAGFIEAVGGSSDDDAASAVPTTNTFEDSPETGASAPTLPPTGTSRNSIALSVDDARDRINNYLSETMGMRAVFLRGQLAASDNISALYEFIDTTAQAYATTAGPEAARQWRDGARTLIQGSDS